MLHYYVCKTIVNNQQVALREKFDSLPPTDMFVTRVIQVQGVQDQKMPFIVRITNICKLQIIPWNDGNFRFLLIDFWEMSGNIKWTHPYALVDSKMSKCVCIIYIC